ncbi:MAG: helix-turn-helix transcriptional regulator [Clostridia bacterium]|nr:helix-turn-helix transcriptional regulator [Clostridia bacterium]
MEKTLGHRILSLRKEKSLTQEELSELLGVSAQAVSKWENDAACPDIMLLPKLAKILGVTTDLLLSGEKEQDTVFVPQAERKSMEKMMLRVRVISSDGHKVNINLPVALVKVIVENGISIGNFGIEADAAQKIDFEKIFNLIEQGVMGKLVEVESAAGDTVEVFVE